MRSMHTLMTAALAGAAMFGTIGAAAAQAQLKVMVFPGLSNLPIFAAQHKDLFAKQGLAIDLLNTPNTAYALLLYKVLKDHGLNKGDYTVRPVGGTTARLEAMTKDKANAAAGVLNPPFAFRAREAGLKDMGPAATAIGAYQAGGAFVMRE